MRLTENQLRALSISPRSFDKMLRWGWTDMAGRVKQWWEHQRPDHDKQFEEEKGRKPHNEKFKPKSKQGSNSR